jgi:hypothetical protein
MSDNPEWGQGRPPPRDEEDRPTEQRPEGGWGTPPPPPPDPGWGQQGWQQQGGQGWPPPPQAPPPQPPPTQQGWQQQGGQEGWGTPPPGQPGYGQQGGWGPPPGPPGYGQPPQRGFNPIIAVVIGLVVLVVAGGLFFWNRGRQTVAQTPDLTGLSEAAESASEALENIPTELPSAPEVDVPTEVSTPPAVPPPPPVAGGGTTSVLDLQVGQCVQEPADTGTGVDTVEVVDCGQSHYAEVFALVDHPAGPSDPFVGQEAIESFAQEQCVAQFNSYVGIDYFQSRYYYISLTPSDGTWSQGDREVVCLGYDPTTSLTTSIRGAAQ